MIDKFLRLNKEVEDAKRLRRKMDMVDVTPNTDDIMDLSHDENERTVEVMEGDMVTIKTYKEEVEDVIKEAKDDFNNVLRQLNLLRHEFDIRIKDNRSLTYEQKKESIKKLMS